MDGTVSRPGLDFDGSYLESFFSEVFNFYRYRLRMCFRIAAMV